VITGFWRLEAKPLGPVHAYVAPATVDAVKCKSCPAQIGPLLEAVAAAGFALTVAAVVAAADEHPPAIACTV